MNLLDNIFGFLLVLDPAISILLISFLISLIMTLAVKFFTNQSLMKDLRDEMKSLQKELKELKNNPKKMSKVNAQFMETNMKYMTHSMRPTLYTFIPVILIFGWLNSHLGYLPIHPNEPFKVTAFFDDKAQGVISLNAPNNLLNDPSEKQVEKEVFWQLKGSAGDYNLSFLYKGKTYTKEVIITNQPKYAPVETDYQKKFLFFSSSNENGLNKIVVENKKLIPFINTPILKDIPLINSMSWFWVYIVSSILFSMSLRRIFNIY
jgi:uncharacterized membrane protein (DUF106 family)